MRSHGADALGDGRVALHWQPFKLHGEKEDQEIADHEDRDGKAEHGEGHHQPVRPRADAGSGDNAHDEGERDGDDQRRAGEGDGRLGTLADQRHHRVAPVHGVAEVAAQQRPGPNEELAPQRLVEAELGADLGDDLGRRVLAGHDGCGIAGGEAQQQEDENGDDRHDGNHREQASDDVGAHG